MCDVGLGTTRLPHAGSDRIASLTMPMNALVEAEARGGSVIGVG